MCVRYFIVRVEMAWWFGQELGLVFVDLVGWACVNIVLCGLCAMSQAAASLGGVHVRIVPDAQVVGSSGQVHSWHSAGAIILCCMLLNLNMLFECGMLQELQCGEGVAILQQLSVSSHRTCVNMSMCQCAQV